MEDAAPAVEIRGVRKTFRSHLLRRRIPAVRDVSFSVRPGEIFGLLGPNGAGKTTTIKMLLGLVRPDAGTARIFGVEVPRPGSRARLGFLPENPYFYDHLSPRELLDYYGGLMGMDADRRRRRGDELLERFGIADLAGRAIRRLSKGQVQRVGMIQTLLSDPDLLVLDEPLSGLDPIGRKEFRDVLLERRRAGAAVLFSSHILPDVEMVADRVAIMNAGVVASEGALSDLLTCRAGRVEVGAGGLPQGEASRLGAGALAWERRGGIDRFIAAGEGEAAELVRGVLAAGGRLIELVPQRETLEDLLMRVARGESDEGRGDPAGDDGGDEGAGAGAHG